MSHNERLWDGKTITEPGCIAGLPISIYHAQPTDGPSVSSTGLRTIWGESAAHFYAKSSLNPNRKPEPERQHFSLGRLAHKLLLEGRDGFDDEFAVRPDCWADWRTKEAKVWRDEQVLAGRTVITDDDLIAVTRMAENLAALPLVKAGILDGKVERSLIWRDAETGIWLKSRPDVIPNGSALVADLKSTASVTDDALAKSLGSFGYHCQGALVGDGLKEVLDIEMEAFALVWSESVEPHCARVTTLTPEDLERGRQQNRAALRILARCLDTGNWPGPGGEREDAIYLTLPAWAAKRIDQQLEVAAAEASDNDNTHQPEKAA